MCVLDVFTRCQEEIIEGTKDRQVSIPGPVQGEKPTPVTPDRKSKGGHGVQKDSEEINWTGARFG